METPGRRFERTMDDRKISRALARVKRGSPSPQSNVKSYTNILTWLKFSYVWDFVFVFFYAVLLMVAMINAALHRPCAAVEKNKK